MRLKSIKISNMHNVKFEEYRFDNVNYICGPNGSGKSTILQAIQLGLLGYIPGTNKTNSAIFEHCNSDKLCVDLEIDNGYETISISRIFSKEGSKIIDSVKVSPETYSIEKLTEKIELAILNFAGFLSLSANKQKEQLISILPSRSQIIQVSQFLKSDEKYDSSCDKLIDDISNQIYEIRGVSDIKSLNANLKDILSSLNAEEKRLTSTIQSLVFYDDYTGEQDVDVIQTQIFETLSLRDELKTYEFKMNSLEDKLKELENYKDLKNEISEDLGYSVLTSKLAKVKQDLEQIQLAIQDDLSQISQYKSDYTHNSKIIESKGICPFIEDNCETIYTQLSDIEYRNSNLIKDINLAEQNLQKDKNKKMELSAAQVSIYNKLKELELRYRTRDHLLKLIDESYTDMKKPEYSSEDLSLKLQKLNDNLVKASANKKYNELLSAIQKQKLELLPQIEFIKSVIKKTSENGLQTKFMEKPFKELESCMDEILRCMELSHLGRAQFKLEEKANSFSFGLNRAGVHIPFELLSSGEKCVYMIVFMSALLKISKAPLMLLILDDFFDHLDEDRFKTVIDNIYNIDGNIQIIAAGVNEIDDNHNIHVISKFEV